MCRMEGLRVGRDKGTWLLVTAQRDVICDGSARILGAGQIRQLSGKSKVKLTSERPEDTILVEVQSGSRWRGEGWVAVERILTSLRRSS